MFKLFEEGDFDFMCVTTNGNINKQGKAVMGKGIALNIKEKYENIDKILGDKIKKLGNKVSQLNDEVISFPTKHNWWDNKACIYLIEESCKELVEKFPNKKILIPRPGCGAGKLKWEYVRNVISKILPDNIFIVHNVESDLSGK